MHDEYFATQHDSTRLVLLLYSALSSWTVFLVARNETIVGFVFLVAFTRRERLRICRCGRVAGKTNHWQFLYAWDTKMTHTRCSSWLFPFYRLYSILNYDWDSNRLRLWHCVLIQNVWQASLELIPLLWWRVELSLSFHCRVIV